MLYVLVWYVQVWSPIRHILSKFVLNYNLLDPSVVVSIVSTQATSLLLDHSAVGYIGIL